MARRPRCLARICFNRQKINLSQVFASQTVGIKQVSEHIWLATFMHYDLGYFDDETCRLESKCWLPPVNMEFLVGQTARTARASRSSCELIARATC